MRDTKPDPSSIQDTRQCCLGILRQNLQTLNWSTHQTRGRDATTLPGEIAFILGEGGSQFGGLEILSHRTCLLSCRVRRPCGWTYGCIRNPIRRTCIINEFYLRTLDAPKSDPAHALCLESGRRAVCCLLPQLLRSQLVCEGMQHIR